MLYHISPKSGLTTLAPRLSSHGTPYVYAVDDLTTGLLFGAPHDDLDLMLFDDPSGRPHLRECRPGAFEEVYRNTACSIYTVAEEGFQRGVTGWDLELVCPHPVPVLEETPVPDLYLRLLEEEREGRLTVERWRDEPEYKRVIAGHLVDRIVRFGLLDGDWQSDPRLSCRYAPLVHALLDAMDGHLL